MANKPIETLNLQEQETFRQEIGADNATNLTTGTLPDARFPATLPAASGVNLTALNATNLTSGTVAPARLASSGTASATTYLAGDGTWKTLASSGGAPTNAQVNTAINTDPAETRYALSVERKQNLGAAIVNLRGQTSRNLRVVTFGDSLVGQGTPLNLSGVIPEAGGDCPSGSSIHVSGTTSLISDWKFPGGSYVNIAASSTRRFAQYKPSPSAAPFHHASIFKVYYVKNTGTFKVRSSTGLGKTISAVPTIVSGTVTVTTSVAHGFAVNDAVTIQGIVFTNGVDPNGVVTIATVPNTTTFTYTLTSGVGPYAITTVSGSVNVSTFPTAAIFTDVSKTISAASLSGDTVTITTNPAHGFLAGDEVIIQNITGFSGTPPNGKFTIATIVDTTRFTYTITGGSGTYTVTSNPKAVAVVNTAGPADTIGVYTVAVTGPAGSNFHRVDVECLTGTVKILYVHALAETGQGRDSYHVSCLGLGGSYDSQWITCQQDNWNTVLRSINPHLIVFKAADFHIATTNTTGNWALVLDRIRVAVPDAVMLLIDGHPWKDPNFATNGLGNPDPLNDNSGWSDGMKAYAALNAPMVQFVECRKFWPTFAKMVEFEFIGSGDGVHLSQGAGRLFESALVLDHVSTLTVPPHINEVSNIKIGSRLAGVSGTVNSGFQNGPEWTALGDLTNANGYIGFLNQVGTGGQPNIGAHLVNYATASTNTKLQGALALGLTKVNHQLVVQSRVNNRMIIGSLGNTEVSFSARDSEAQLEVFGNSATIPTLAASCISGQTANIFEARTNATLVTASTLATAFGSAGALITVPVAHPNPFEVASSSISLANPCVITKATHGLFPNQQIVFSTAGTLPSQIVSGTRYFVLSTNFTTSTFQLSLSFNGPAISTLGSTQNGTHTVTPVIYAESPVTSLTTTGVAQTAILTNGVAGQIKTITCVAVGTSTITVAPESKTGFTTILFSALGDTVTLQYYATIGWVVLSIRGATTPP